MSSHPVSSSGLTRDDRSRTSLHTLARHSSIMASTAGVIVGSVVLKAGYLSGGLLAPLRDQFICSSRGPFSDWETASEMRGVWCAILGLNQL